jgi:hypothetical protein
MLLSRDITVNMLSQDAMQVSRAADNLKAEFQCRGQAAVVRL